MRVREYKINKSPASHPEAWMPNGSIDGRIMLHRLRRANRAHCTRGRMSAFDNT